MSSTMDGYARFVQAAIRREMDVIGDERAVDLARSVDGLTVDDDGTVRSLDRSGKAVLEDLVATYVNDSGEVAAFIIARRLGNLVDDDSPELPENVGRHL